jgi:hypothetical protein
VAGINVAGLADSAELFVVAYLGTRIVVAAAFSDATPGAGLDRAALPIALLLAAATVGSVCVEGGEPGAAGAGGGMGAVAGHGMYNRQWNLIGYMYNNGIK